MSHPHPELSAPPELPSGGLRVIPLSGLGEVGRTMTVVEHAGRLLIVDCGVLFPEDPVPSRRNGADQGDRACTIAPTRRTGGNIAPTRRTGGNIAPTRRTGAGGPAGRVSDGASWSCGWCVLLGDQRVRRTFTVSLAAEKRGVPGKTTLRV
nr:hypothetical protein [Nocardioides sp.]